MSYENGNSATGANYPICRHIRVSGHRCQSPALEGAALCFYHRTFRRAHRRHSAGPAPLRPETLAHFHTHPEDAAQLALIHSRPAPLDFPPLEDAESVQIAISLLFAALAAGQVDPDHARNLLYALQLASQNVRALTPAAAAAGPSTVVRRVVATRQGHALAPPDDGNGTPSEVDHPKSSFERIADWVDECRRRAAAQAEAAQAAQSETPTEIEATPLAPEIPPATPTE
jgi:hypothetical protein